MDFNREEVWKKIVGEENVEFLKNNVAEFKSYLVKEFESILLQKEQSKITNKLAERSVKTLYGMLEVFHNRVFPSTVNSLEVNLSTVDVETLIHDFNDDLYIYFNTTYLEKFRKK